MMTPAQGISKFGFRKWYERQLIESHVWFVTAFMSAVLIMALLEDLNLRGPEPASRSSLVIIAVATLLGGGALRRYMRMLLRAETLAEQSVCPHCTSYGTIRVLAAGRPEEGSEGGEGWQWMRVACKKCNNQWRMEER